MTSQEINKRFAELVGICWHEWRPLRTYTNIGECACGGVFNIYKDEFAKHLGHNNNSDLCDDPRLVLEVMMKREDYIDFLMYLFTSHPYQSIWNGAELMISIIGISEVLKNYVLDTTGKLALASIKFLEKK